jgi:predicted nicotinamide N-methyase
MEEADTFLSDVHVGTFCPLSDRGTLVTRFTFTQPHDGPREAELDKDGDMVVSRKAQHVVCIEHSMSTTLQAVGLQVWRGSLLMADYLLYQGSDRFRGSVILELGAGTGLVSIIAGLKAGRVFCTDIGKELLDLCQRNIEGNIDFSSGDTKSRRNITVRELDWKSPFSESSAGFSWSEDDLKSLSKASFILASDVVYDDVLTNAFFTCLAYLHSIIDEPPAIIVSLERRVNFSLEEMDVASPYYRHFRTCLDLSYTTSMGELKFQAQQMSTDFSQYSDYDRVKELAMWMYTPLALLPL